MLKKIEIVLGIIFLVGFSLKFINLPGGGMFLGISLILLSFLYLLFSYFIFYSKNDQDSEIKFFAKNKVFKIIFILFSGWVFAIGLLGVLIRIQSYSFDAKLLEIALILLILLLLFLILLLQKFKLIVYKKLLIRGVLVFVAGLLTYLLY
jgi:uncharacterized membrane protein YkgB